MYAHLPSVEVCEGTVGRERVGYFFGMAPCLLIASRSSGLGVDGVVMMPVSGRGVWLIGRSGLVVSTVVVSPSFVMVLDESDHILRSK